jgi:hypothetical protein
MHAAKTLGWAGATPLLTAFSRPKQSGVAPARHAGSVTMFLPRACGEVIRLIADSKQSQTWKGEPRDGSSESTTEAAKD